MSMSMSNVNVHVNECFNVLSCLFLIFLDISSISAPRTANNIVERPKTYGRGNTAVRCDNTDQHDTVSMCLIFNMIPFMIMCY